MKLYSKISLVAIFLALSSVLFGQATYRIYDGSIILELSNDTLDNQKMINQVINDSSARACKTLEITFNGRIGYSSVGQLNWIRYLFVSSNYPMVITESWSDLKQLKSLTVYTEIESIDSSALLEKLEYFSCKESGLDTFPTVLCCWTGLKELNLQGGAFSTIPECFGQLTRLEALNLSNNAISELPVAFSELERLKTLGIGGNRFSDFPKVICELESLEFLYLTKNEGVLENDPDCLKDLPNFKEAYIW